MVLIGQISFEECDDLSMNTDNLRIHDRAGAAYSFTWDRSRQLIWEFGLRVEKKMKY